MLGVLVNNVIADIIPDRDGSSGLVRCINLCTKKKGLESPLVTLDIT